MRDKISRAAARRIALAAQGFADAGATSQVNRRHLRRVLSRTGLLQIDSVSAVVRAHYMPLYSRLGPYPMGLLDEATAGHRRLLFEYWAHGASFLPLETWPLMQWRMERASRNDASVIYKGLARWAQGQRPFIEEIYRQVQAHGPVAASDIGDEKGSGGWWGWSEAKHAFEWLFWAGRLTSAYRRGFERVYDLPERTLPQSTLALPTPSAHEAHRELVRIAARAHGVATYGDLRDYFRLAPAETKAAIDELVEEGSLLPISVEGWSRPAWLYRDARIPRRIEARTLLAPFDPIVFERARAEALFDFRYRIEIYTPAEKRRYGYYVMPFLLNETIAARVDLRADRPGSVLRVHAAFAEPDAPADTAVQLLEELKRMQAWLQLDRLEIAAAGDLGPQLADLATRLATS